MLSELVQKLHDTHAFWEIKNSYDLFKRKYQYNVEIMDGEPIICGGVGHVGGFKEVKVKADTIEDAIQQALDQWSKL